MCSFVFINKKFNNSRAGKWLRLHREGKGTVSEQNDRRCMPVVYF
jgi:hypothetical protein